MTRGQSEQPVPLSAESSSRVTTSVCCLMSSAPSTTCGYTAAVTFLQATLNTTVSILVSTDTTLRGHNTPHSLGISSSMPRSRTLDSSRCINRFELLSLLCLSQSSSMPLPLGSPMKSVLTSCVTHRSMISYMFRGRNCRYRRGCVCGRPVGCSDHRQNRTTG